MVLILGNLISHFLEMFVPLVRQTDVENLEKFIICCGRRLTTEVNIKTLLLFKPSARSIKMFYHDFIDCFY